jgi:hypothetical protein
MKRIWAELNWGERGILLYLIISAVAVILAPTLWEVAGVIETMLNNIYNPEGY